MESFISGGNVKYSLSLRQKSFFKITGLIRMVLSKCGTGIWFVDKSVDWCWWHWRLQAKIVGVKIFGRDSRTSLVDVYSYFVAKDLRGVLDNGYQKKRPQSRGHPRSCWGGGKLYSKVRRRRENSFIFVNNVVTDCLTIEINAISHNK